MATGVDKDVVVATGVDKDVVVATGVDKDVVVATGVYRGSWVTESRFDPQCSRRTGVTDHRTLRTGLPTASDLGSKTKIWGLCVSQVVA